VCERERELCVRVRESCVGEGERVVWEWERESACLLFVGIEYCFSGQES